MNPRVSRCSALASKATGFPIARIGTKVAVGYTPRRAAQRHHARPRRPRSSRCSTTSWSRSRASRSRSSPTADPALTTQMKSVGEVMAIGRTFKEALQKGFRGLEIDRIGWVDGDQPGDDRLDDGDRRDRARGAAHARRRSGSSRSSARSRPGSAVDEISRAQRHRSLVPVGSCRSCSRPSGVGRPRPAGDRRRARAAAIRRMKRLGFCDKQLAAAARHDRGRRPRAAPSASACARPTRPSTPAPASFPPRRPYLYSSYDEENEAAPVGDRTVVILGSGPNRIGQGVEFDYCCVRAALEFRELGYKTIMVNSNPETVSTDFDISDTLYFEPLTLEDVLEIVAAREADRRGGPARRPDAAAAGARRSRGQAFRSSAPRPMRSTSPRIASRSRRWRASWACGSREAGVARSVPEAVAVAARIGYPVLIRPVLRAGRPGDGDRLRRRVAAALLRARRAGGAGAPGADRPVPRGRVRGRRGRHLRRQALHHRRRHAAHRGRRRALGRLGLRDAAVPDHGAAGRGDEGVHQAFALRARCGRAASTCSTPSRTASSTCSR